MEGKGITRRSALKLIGGSALAAIIAASGASLRTLMERFYGYVPDNAFMGKRLFFIYQGAGPSKMMIDDGEYSMSRFARIYGFTYEGMANDRNEARELQAKLK